MRYRFAILASMLAVQPVPAQTAARAHGVLGDLCARPAGFAPPFTKVYPLRGGGTIVFVAVEHVHANTAPTIAEIGAAFDRYKPDLVLVEGASAQKSVDPAYLRFLADRARQQYADGHIQENLYAVKRAAEAGIPYQGWNIAPHDDYVGDVADGFAIPDAIGAHLLRAHVDPFAPAAAAVQTELDAVPHMRRPDGYDYTAWYRGAYGSARDPAAGTPCGTGIASRIVKAESLRRTQTIVDLLAAQAKPGKTVLVEAGANHWLALRDYLASLTTAPR